MWSQPEHHFLAQQGNTWVKRVQDVEAETPTSRTKGLTLGGLLHIWSPQCAPLGNTDLHPLFDGGHELSG